MLISHKSTFRESDVDIPIAHLTVADDYSSFELSDYMIQLKSSVEVIGAVLVSDGSCSLDQNTIAMNISIRATLAEGAVLKESYCIKNQVSVGCVLSKTCSI